jgi:hypothetical protein
VGLTRLLPDLCSLRSNGVAGAFRARRPALNPVPAERNPKGPRDRAASCV